MSNQVLMIGYSGHAYVAIDCIESAGLKCSGYCDLEEKSLNPYGLEYFGSETEVLKLAENKYFFIGIGDNKNREKVHTKLYSLIGISPINAIHKSAVVSRQAHLAHSGVMIGPGAVINALSHISEGVIVNSAAVVEHDCNVSAFAHIGPNSTLTGNVTVGARTLIGAGAVILPGIKIGSNCVIGAGAVIVENIPDKSTVVGNPGRIINHNL